MRAAAAAGRQPKADPRRWLRDEQVNGDTDRNGYERTEGEEQPLLTPLGSDGGLSLANEDRADLLCLFLVDLQKPLLFFRLGDERFAGSLLSRKGALQLVHEGYSVDERGADFGDPIMKPLAWILCDSLESALPVSFEKVYEG